MLTSLLHWWVLLREDEDDLVEWRSKYSLSPHIALRAPASEERASIHAPGDITVYEAFLETGFRGVVPLNPPAWRILIAIQNLGDLEYLSFGINEILFSYHLAPLNGGEGHLYLCPRSSMPIGRNYPKLTGKDHLSVELHSAADDSFAAYQEAAKVMSAKRGSAIRTTSGDDVTVIGSQSAIMVKTEPTSLSQGRKTRGGRVVTRESHRSAEADCSAVNLATTLANLNLSVFSRDGTVLLIGETSEVIQVLQGGFLRTISQLFHLGERLSTENVSSAREELEALKREAMEEKDRCMAQELEEKLKASEKIANEASADALAASQENQKLAKDIETAAEDFKLEMGMAGNGARVVARLELMREWINKQSDQWDLARALDQYKTVVLEDAKNKGIAPPSFDDEPAVPSSRARSSARP
ncbi:hypothetical protein Bca4012_063428 [Brassica carinata]